MPLRDDAMLRMLPYARCAMRWRVRAIFRCMRHAFRYDTLPSRLMSPLPIAFAPYAIC